MVAKLTCQPFSLDNIQQKMVVRADQQSDTGTAEMAKQRVRSYFRDLRDQL